MTINSGNKLYFLLVLLIFVLASGCTHNSPVSQRNAANSQQKDYIPPAAVPARNNTQGETQANNSSAPQQTASNVSFSTNVDTGQTVCYNNLNPIACPSRGEPFYGQDANYNTGTPEYRDNGDGTVTDLRTGLMWTKAAGVKHRYYDVVGKTYSFDGYSDWRVPTVKELYTLMDFMGTDPDSMNESSSLVTPYINTTYFDFKYGNLTNGDRIIDSQWITSNIYTSTVMDGQQCFFGVNFADGRIKCYPTVSMKNNGYYIRYVRGPAYGINKFVDNHDGTITYESSGLLWQKNDRGYGMDWESALSYCQNLTLAGYSDWRLPNAKELQYIVNYSRSPDATDSPAIDPIFQTTSITNEAGQKDYPYFWTSTTHISQVNGQEAVYISFGRAMGYFFNQWIDVHGAGAQRSDPKVGSESDYPHGHGPQGDARRIDNYVRCVRGGAEPANNAGIAPPVQNQQVQNTAPQGSTQTSVQNSQPGTQGGQPPAAAISACSGKSSGDSCSFSAPKGTVTGKCQDTASGLACVP